MSLDAAGIHDQETFRKWLARGLNGIIFNGQNKIRKTDIIFLIHGKGAYEMNEARFQ